MDGTMAAIVYQTDKRSGITYAYESVSYWDKEKKQSRSKRTLIGRVDKTSGGIVPTDGRGRKNRAGTDSKPSKRGPAPAPEASRRFYGATYLFDAIGEKLGIVADLKRCFGDTHKQILSIAYYLILEEQGALFRFEKWGVLHKHPHGKHISSQRSSELFASITEAQKQQFFTLQGKRRADQEFWAYDTTSISSYSEVLAQIQYGHNKEYDPLAQLNLAIIFGASSNLPFYYRKLAGNIPDSKTVRHLLADLDQMGFAKVKLVMDRGFYSERNINALYHDHRKFLLSVSMSLKFAQKELEPLYDTFRTFEHYDADYELYMRTVTATWKYRHERPNKGDMLEEDRRLYIHYYFNIERAAEEEKRLDRRLMGLRDELLQDRPRKEHEALYARYFTVTRTPKRGVKVQIKEDAVARTKRYYGFFILITNEKMSAKEALQIYRNKDVVEKAFGNLKERLNLRRLLVSSEQSLEGKLFVAFIALIYLSYIKKQMQEANLFRTYTIGTLLDKLDLIECFEAPGYKLRVGEILKKQREIYTALGIDPPTSL
jgi:transposase